MQAGEGGREEGGQQVSSRVRLLGMLVCRLLGMLVCTRNSGLEITRNADL